MNPNQEYYVIKRDRDEHGGHMDGCILWWRPEGKGYTYDLNEAGIFTAADMAKNYPSLDSCRYIPREIVDANTYSPRLAWWSRTRGPNGTSAIYDALKTASLAADPQESGTESSTRQTHARSTSGKEVPNG